MQLFRELYDAVGKRPIERVSLETRIRKTDVYRYLPKAMSKRGGLAPNPKTTATIVRVLLRMRKYEVVGKMLENAAFRVSSSCQECRNWTRVLRYNGIIYDPLSEAEKYRLERDLLGITQNNLK